MVGARWLVAHVTLPGPGGNRRRARDTSLVVIMAKAKVQRSHDVAQRQLIQPHVQHEAVRILRLHAHGLVVVHMHAA